MRSRPEFESDTITDVSQLPPGTSMYLASWDQIGLECLVNLTALDKARVWSTLSDRPPPDLPPLGFMMMRAQANLHRCPEIVTFTVDDSDLPEDMLRELFETDPQVIVNAIRERCTHHFDGRRPVGHSRIT